MKWNNSVFFKNKVVKFKVCIDVVRVNAVGKILCHLEWDDVWGCSKLKQYLLALINIRFLMKLNVGQINESENDITHLKYCDLF